MIFQNIVIVFFISREHLPSPKPLDSVHRSEGPTSFNSILFVCNTQSKKNYYDCYYVARRRGTGKAKKAKVEFSRPSGQYGLSDRVIFQLAEASLSKGLNYPGKIHVKPQLTRAWGMSVFASHSEASISAATPGLSCLSSLLTLSLSLGRLQCYWSLICSLRLCFDTVKLFARMWKTFYIIRQGHHSNFCFKTMLLCTLEDSFLCVCNNHFFSKIVQKMHKNMKMFSTLM